MASLIPEHDLSPFATVEEAIADIRNGKIIVVADAPDRESEGDLTIAAQFATPEAVNFMASHARGLVCLCLTGDRCDELDLSMMTARNQAQHRTAFTVSIEAREGVTTGISAADRAHTIQVAIDPTKGASDLVQPGHIFPLRATAGGVLQRTGHTEAGVYDLQNNDVPGATDRDKYYWRDVGTIDSFYDAHQDLISALPIFNLYNQEWPIFTQQLNAPPAKFVRDPPP